MQLFRVDVTISTLDSPPVLHSWLSAALSTGRGIGVLHESESPREHVADEQSFPAAPPQHDLQRSALDPRAAISVQLPKMKR